ncbi:MAG TPA: hypothetical protein VHA56_22620 [Mucilaginibacter sp.]|nr:hypothetical protein [Mucilaginibacter sp.]
MKKRLFIGGMLTVASLVIGFEAHAQQSGADVYQNYSSENKDSNGNDVETVQTFTKGKQFRFKMVNDKLTELYVDGVKIPPAEYGKYDAEVKAISKQIKLDRIQAEKDRAQAAKDRVRADIDRARAEKDRQLAELNRGQAEKDRVQADLDRAQAEKDRQQAEKDRGQAELDRIQAQKDRQQADKDRVQAELDRKQAEKDRRLMAELIDDLVKDKIIPDRDALNELVITGDEMTVNGKKQPDAVFKRYSEKYKRFAGGSFTYGNNHNIRFRRN